MYLFPNFEDMYKPGKLKQFVDDLHSGKLHREFHDGPDLPEEIPIVSNDQSTEKSSDIDDNRIDMDLGSISIESSPPESTFIKLAPSEKRYTLLRNEL